MRFKVAKLTWSQRNTLRGNYGNVEVAAQSRNEAWQKAVIGCKEPIILDHMQFVDRSLLEALRE